MWQKQFNNNYRLLKNMNCTKNTRKCLNYETSKTNNFTNRYLSSINAILFIVSRIFYD
jgi:hypothetical protein